MLLDDQMILEEETPAGDERPEAKKQKLEVVKKART